MAEIESWWGRFPDYRIDLTPWTELVRVRRDGVLLAESTRSLLVAETDHAARLYVPADDVRWELFVASELETVCPFKGRASYWSLRDGGEGTQDILWGYVEPMPEVSGLQGFVCFYDDRVDTVVTEQWADGTGVDTRFPNWGDQRELLRVIDAQPTAERRFECPAHGRTDRNVVEAGQLLADAIVAASKTVPAQRVCSASMIFSKAATHDLPVELDVDIVHGGRTFSTLEVRARQSDVTRAVGIILLGVDAPDVARASAPMPTVPSPEELPALDHPEMQVTGREIRVFDNAVDWDPAHVGPPEILVWTRFRDRPREPHLHTALLAQSVTHWTIGAAMRPHDGLGESMAHFELSTGIMKATLAVFEQPDVSEWLLYANHATFLGSGLAQSDGKVFTQDGRLVASYTVQAMIRTFERPAESVGGWSTAM